MFLLIQVDRSFEALYQTGEVRASVPEDPVEGTMAGTLRVLETAADNVNGPGRDAMSVQ